MIGSIREVRGIAQGNVYIAMAIRWEHLMPEQDGVPGGTGVGRR
jgi:hypothetical protein